MRIVCRVVVGHLGSNHGIARQLDQVPERVDHLPMKVPVRDVHKWYRLPRRRFHPDLGALAEQVHMRCDGQDRHVDRYPVLLVEGLHFVGRDPQWPIGHGRWIQDRVDRDESWGCRGGVHGPELRLIGLPGRSFRVVHLKDDPSPFR